MPEIVYLYVKYNYYYYLLQYLFYILCIIKWWNWQWLIIELLSMLKKYGDKLSGLCYSRFTSSDLVEILKFCLMRIHTHIRSDHKIN